MIPTSKGFKETSLKEGLSSYEVSEVKAKIALIDQKLSNPVKLLICDYNVQLIVCIAILRDFKETKLDT